MSLEVGKGDTVLKGHMELEYYNIMYMYMLKLVI